MRLSYVRQLIAFLEITEVHKTLYDTRMACDDLLSALHFKSRHYSTCYCRILNTLIKSSHLKWLYSGTKTGAV